jgi:hypothetical protein
MFGHEILMLANECRMISKEIGQSGGGCGGCCCGSGHFDFVSTVNECSQMVLVGGRMETVEMCQGGCHDRGGWRRRRMRMMSVGMILMEPRGGVGCSRGGNGGRRCGGSYHHRRRRVIGRRGRLLLARSRGRSHRRRRIELGVLAFAVPPQVNFALESPAAVVAGERLVAGVLPRVGNQVGRLAKGFPADGAFVRLFTCTQSNFNKRLYFQISIGH